MSSAVKTTYVRDEIREVRSAFYEWSWVSTSIEPNSRVTVLHQAHQGQETRGYLCRCGDGWLWAGNVLELLGKAKHETPLRWQEAVRDLGGDAMRVPTEQELEMGGFRLIDEPEPEEDEPAEKWDEANDHIDRGFYHLNRPAVDGLAASRSMAHFLGSIAISLHKLVALHEKYDIDNLQVVVDDGPDHEQEKRAAAGDPEQPIREPDEPFPSGPVPDEDFPYAR